MWREKGEEEEQTIKMSDSRPRRDFQVVAIVISCRNYCLVDWFEGRADDVIMCSRFPVTNSQRKQT